MTIFLATMVVFFALEMVASLIGLARHEYPRATVGSPGEDVLALVIRATVGLWAGALLWGGGC